MTPLTAVTAPDPDEPAEVTLDLSGENLDLGDCIDLEELAGRPAFEIFASAQAGAISAKELTAIVFVAQRKVNPAFTFEDARRVKIASLPKPQ